MTKKDFFILIIKLFGLYSIITALFISIPQNIAFVFNSFGGEIDIYPIIYIIVILTFVIALFSFLIFKSHHIVKILKLEKGFDSDNIELGKLTTKEIIKIAAIIIGGFLIIDNLPIFIQHTISAFYSGIHEIPIKGLDKWNWFVNGANILIGYLLITNLKFVSKLIDNKTKEE